ncbi:NAD+ synthase [Candidatus Nitrosotenuis uzonensis]|uniref:NH(3)-dependent NAD(+) synthetase n=1 Tax=Candidatus Nitrosotenuis uzonensis TaxID=1407055 RepID=V6ASS3_9ARCH|nr:NAD+ synthase [Candidatus Nitrosotenuis uzonensis]CDI05761.1 NH(3)-dependent NAD(+) synthetase [Candidatus Nitrosotenuis uzonensis]
MNQEILNQIKKQDYEAIQNSITAFLANHIKKSNARGLVFGLSGGIDSAVIAHICAKSFHDKTLALIMPDSKISPKEETEDALEIVDSLKLEYKLIDINLIHAQFANILEPEEKALGNLRARIRASILYYYANLRNYLVIGSSDRSEQMIGYFTKFGDGSADILPIASLYKTQIRELARYLGVKDTIISKKSSPHLWHGHLAEEEIGISYEEIDIALYCIVDKAMTVERAAEAAVMDKDKIEKIYQLYKKSEHKRIMPPRL